MRHVLLIIGSTPGADPCCNPFFPLHEPACGEYSTDVDPVGAHILVNERP